MLGVPTQLWGLWRSAENMNTLTVKVLGGSCHAACGPSFQGTVIQTNITVQVTHGRAPESLCVPHPHLSDNGYLRESLPFPGTSSPHLSLYTLNMGHPQSKGRTRTASTEKPAASPAQQTLEESTKTWSGQEGTQAVGTWQRLYKDI